MAAGYSGDTEFNVSSEQTSARWTTIFAGSCAALAIVFLALPWPLETKALAVLHGLCAQQPSHTFYFGDTRLPFDARMTGIYGGFASASLVLLALMRWRASRIPPVATLIVLGLFVVAMGIDGVNSTLHSVRQWHLYEPHNTLRLVTGQLTGVTLAAFIWLLVGQIGFDRRARQNRAPVAGWRDLGIILVGQSVFTLLVLSGWHLLYVPLAMMLLISALTAVGALTLSFVLLFGRRESIAHSTSALAGPATLALVITLMIIGGLGGGRFLLEWWLNIPTTVPEIRGMGM